MVSLFVPAVIVGQRQLLHCQLEGRYCKATSSLFFMAWCLHFPLSGPALGDVGEAMRELSEVKDSLDMEVKQNFIDPLQNLHDKDLREIQVCAVCLLRPTQVLICYWVTQQRAHEFPAAPPKMEGTRDGRLQPAVKAAAPLLPLGIVSTPLGLTSWLKQYWHRFFST